MGEYFPKPKSLRRRVKVELNLSNYATKANLKNAIGVDTSDFAKRTDLANLNSDVDILDIDKLKNVPSNLRNLKSKVDKLVNLSKLSDVVKSDVVKKDLYNARSKLLKIKYLILLT